MQHSTELMNLKYSMSARTFLFIVIFLLYLGNFQVASNDEDLLHAVVNDDIIPEHDSKSVDAEGDVLFEVLGGDDIIERQVCEIYVHT